MVGGIWREEDGVSEVDRDTRGRERKVGRLREGDGVYEMEGIGDGG